MNIKVDKKQYSELIKLIYWAVLEENINYNEDFKSMCNAVRTADGSTLEEETKSELAKIYQAQKAMDYIIEEDN